MEENNKNNSNENLEDINKNIIIDENQNSIKSDQANFNNEEIINQQNNELNNNYDRNIITNDDDKIKINDERSKSSKNSSKFFQAHQERLKKKQQLYMISAFFSILVVVFFTSSVFCQIEIENHYKVNKILRTIYNFSDYFHFSSISEPISFFDVIFHNTYNENEKENFWLFDHNYHIISNIRITQRKMRLKENKMPLSPLINENTYRPKWFKEKIDINEKTGDFEDQYLHELF